MSGKGIDDTLKRSLLSIFSTCCESYEENALAELVDHLPEESKVQIFQELAGEQQKQQKQIGECI